MCDTLWGRRWLGASGALVLGCALAGCAHSVSVRPEAVRLLEGNLAALAPTVSAAEAERVAVCAWDTSQRLAEEYGVVRPAVFHNLLVNLRLKRRGLCYHWTEDLAARLQGLGLSTLDLHWGIARAGRWREHNSVVVTARGQPFQEGLVLDSWRHSGDLHWARVAADRYPWVEAKWDP